MKTISSKEVESIKRLFEAYNSGTCLSSETYQVINNLIEFLNVENNFQESSLEYASDMSR